MIKNKKIRFALCLLLCWLILFTVETGRLVGSTDPSVAPHLTVATSHKQGDFLMYRSLGFTQVYHLGEGDEFVSGEFRLFGITAERWE